MINTISTSKLYRECCEKSNIKILRIEDLLYNEIFIKSAEPLRDDKNILIGYNVVSLEGIIKYDRKVIIEFYDIVSKKHFTELNKLDLTSITEHFKNIGIHIIVEFKEGELLATYSIDKEVYSNVINSKGITNIDVDTWKKIKSAKVLNTYAHLEMYSHKSSATVDFIKQLEDFTGIKREKGNINRELDTTIETFKKLGIEISINLNCGEKNPQKDRYKKATVNIEYKEVQAPKREEIKEPRKPRDEKKDQDEELKECPLTTEELFDYARNYGVILRDNDIYYMGDCSVMLAVPDTIKSGTKEAIIKFIEEEEIRNELYDYLESYKDDIEDDEEFNYFKHRENVEWWTSLNITRQ